LRRSRLRAARPAIGESCPTVMEDMIADQQIE
jgi:hypothetical protein